MKKTVRFPKYLTLGLIILISVTANQNREGSRINGSRRNWNIKTSFGWMEFPTFRDNGIANTGCLVGMKSPLAASVIPNEFKSLNIKNSRSGTFETYSLNKSISRVQKFNETSSQLHPGLLMFLSCYTTYDNWFTKSGKKRKSEQEIPSDLKRTLRFLERLPGH